MENGFHMVSDVSPAISSWHLNVRVVRSWSVYSFIKPDQLDSIEMVLMDVKVCTGYIYNKYICKH
jgi:hypothetical protein